MATHYKAEIKLAGHYFPLSGPITEENMLMLANNGTTPHPRQIEKLKPLADAIRAALDQGHAFETSTATITPETRREKGRALTTFAPFPGASCPV